MDNESQCKMILFWLKDHKVITAKIARQLCGCERLAARVHDLRRKGIPIETKTKTYINKAGHLVRYAEYRLEDSNA